MPKPRTPFLLKILPVAAVAVFATRAKAFGWAGDMSYLATETVVITLLSSMVLLLFGVLCRLRSLRLELERKSRALEKSERHLRLMGDNLPNVTLFQLVRDEAGVFRFNYLSKGYERALGLDRDEAVADARTAMDQVYEEDLPILRKAYVDSREAMAAVDFQLRVLSAAGELKWLQVSAVPHLDDGNLLWDGLMQDISLNKRIEDALLDENRNLQNLFETIDDFLVVCDASGRLVHTNPTVVRRLGYSPEELGGMNLFGLYAEEARSEAFKAMAQLQSDRAASCNLPLQSKGGHRIPVEMNFFQGLWKNRKALFGVARDVAGRQRTEAALRESQRMLQLTLDTIPLSVFWKDKDSVYLGCNKAFIRECGMETPDQVVGKTPHDLFNETTANEIIERDQQLIRSGRPVQGMLQSHTLIDGSVAWRDVTKIPLRDEEGNAVGVLGVWRDVTEQNQAEERLKRTLDDMERFNQLMRGRERRTLELKAEINALLAEMGRPRKYRTTTEDAP